MRSLILFSKDTCCYGHSFVLSNIPTIGWNKMHFWGKTCIKDFISFDLIILSRQLIPVNMQNSIQFLFKEDRFLLLVLI